MKVCDRRGRAQHLMMAALLASLAVILISAANAGQDMPTQSKGLSLSWEFRAADLILALLAYIYISGQQRTGKSISKIFDKLERKVEVDEHRRLEDKVDKKLDQDEHERICPREPLK